MRRPRWSRRSTTRRCCGRSCSATGSSARCRPRSVYVGAGIVAGAGLFVIWRERQLGLQPREPEDADAADLSSRQPRRRGRTRSNALKVMMVRVSWMPGMVCTFSLTKWPMSVAAST